MFSRKKLLWKLRRRALKEQWNWQWRSKDRNEPSSGTFLRDSILECLLPMSVSENSIYFCKKVSRCWRDWLYGLYGCSGCSQCASWFSNLVSVVPSIYVDMNVYENDFKQNSLGNAGSSLSRGESFWRKTLHILLEPGDCFQMQLQGQLLRL